MNPCRIPRFLAGALCAIPLVLAQPAGAQDESLPVLTNKAVQAMNAQKWEEALALNARTVELYGRNQPLMLHGPKFGGVYYRKGLCELKLKQWQAAMESFEVCYRDFPNPPGKRDNQFQKMALLRWGEAALGAQKWELAITQFEKFLKERDPAQDTYPQGSFHIGMAICHYNLGRIPQGNKHFETAIKNKIRFKVGDSAIVTGFQQLVGAAIRERNEQAVLDFIAANRGELIIDPYEMHRFSNVFMRLAGEAVAAEMDRAALALYQFVPSTEAVIGDIRARLKALGPAASIKDGPNFYRRDQLEKELSELEAMRRGKQMPEMVKLGAAAFLHEKHGNARGAFSAYLQLETFYPNSERREDNLYNLVRTSSLLGRPQDTQRYAADFLKNFPDSRYVPPVRRMMLSVLFYEGDYETCIEIAEPLLERLEPGSEEHDICLHVLGGSYFYTGQFEKAQPLLDQHVEKYPKSPFALPAAYFRASNLYRMQQPAKAGQLLDEFLKTYPDPGKNPFIAFALYDRANCHAAEEQWEPALDKLARLIKEFPDASVIDQAYLLRGNIEQNLERPERAETAYLKALEIAEKRDATGSSVAGEALFSLVAMLGQPDNPRLKEAVPFADRFWENHAEDSPLKAKMAVAQFAAFSAVGRAKDGLTCLQEVITELAGKPDSPGLEALINSYKDAYLTQHTPEELKEHYYNFPGIRSTNSAARALLRVAIIGVFEGELKKATDEARKRDISAMITVLFQQLKTDFALKDLSNHILVKVGDYLRTTTATPREALPYYDEALGRADKSRRYAALLGRADVLGASASPADIDKALADLGTVYAESEDKVEREFALYRIIELLMAKRDFAKAADQARIYLDTEKTGFKKYSPQVGLLLARSFEERKMDEDAIQMYVKVWAHMGNIKVSAPAMLSWMRLLWDRNKPSAGPGLPADRQGAYEGGARYIELTGRFKDKMIDSDLQLWLEVEKQVKIYEADPGIKTVEQIKREQEEARKKGR